MMEDNFAAIFWRLIVNLVGERAGSMQYSSNHYPGRLGGLLGSAEERDETMKVFKRDLGSVLRSQEASLPIDEGYVLCFQLERQGH